MLELVCEKFFLAKYGLMMFVCFDYLLFSIDNLLIEFLNEMKHREHLLKSSL